MLSMERFKKCVAQCLVYSVFAVASLTIVAGQTAGTTTTVLTGTTVKVASPTTVPAATTRNRAVNTTTIAATPIPTAAPAASAAPAPSPEEYEYAPYDGWYNNFAHPDWGASDTALLRLVPPAYGDGVYTPSGADRPNPITIARIVFDGDTGMPSYRNRTALLVFFGQQMVEEVIDAQLQGCPPEFFNIPIPKCHPQYDPNCRGDREIPLQRTRYDQRTGYSPNVPREQLNEVSPYFDGTLMYGPHKAWADSLRLFKGGRLKATNDTNSSDMYFPAMNTIRLPYANPPPPRDHMLKPVSRFFTIGNPRGNENPFLLTFGILWFRYHNFRARQLENAHPDWNDEKLFNEARKWTIAVHAKIVYYDFIPAWLNQTLPDYFGPNGTTGYNPHVHPQIAHVFQSAAGRFGHTLVPPGVLRRNGQCVFRNTSSATTFAGQRGLRTCNSYWNPTEAIRETDIDELLMGMASQITEREDNIITPDLHGNVFGGLDFSRRDLMAVNIQRGRDHGLADYNTAREAFGLPRLNNFSDYAIENPHLYNEKRYIFDNLTTLYGADGIDKLDIWPGGMLETSPSGPGRLFRAIITNQFTRIRAADRFWFENYKMNKLFTADEVAEIHRVSIKDVIVAVTKIKPEEIQDNPFFHVEGDVCPYMEPQLSHLPGGGLEECTPFKTFDYFSGSEASYIGTLCLIFGSVIPIVLTLYCLGKRRDFITKEGQTRVRERTIKNMPQTNITVYEWIGKTEGTRLITLTLDTSNKHVLIKNSQKELLRTIDTSLLGHSGSVAILLSSDVEMKLLVIRIPREYDLVLKFQRPNERQDFLSKFKSFIDECGGMRLDSPIIMSQKAIKSAAVTRAIRQKTLESFFSAVFSHALKFEAIGRRHSVFEPEVSADIIVCELTKYEFAEALGLSADSMFVKNMFKMVDKADNGYISFREFLDFFVIFSTGSPEEKARLMFDMYDLNRTGHLSKDDFKMMLRSLVELANEHVEDNKIDSLMDLLFRSGNLESKSHITFEDFNRMLRDYHEELGYSSLSFTVGDVNMSKNAMRENAPARARKTIIRAYSVDPDLDKKTNRLSSALEEIKTIQSVEPVGTWRQHYASFVHYIEIYRRQIFWVTLYCLVVAGIFIERAYYYSFEREQFGLRRIAGYGVTITRGAANVQMFTYSSLLVTMCRNIITFLRGTFLNRFIPFDDAVKMHTIIAIIAALFTTTHVLGHCLNFYHISTQLPNDLACIFRNFYHPTDALPKFNRWAWMTLTGVTGILMCFHVLIIYIFSTKWARKKTYKAFWITHATYPIFFIFMLLHGAGRLIQAPFLYYFLLGPVILFTIDQLISVSRKRIEISVVKAELLPSGVTNLIIRKPPNFEYSSGQWIRLACLGHSSREFHPFTLTSAPNDAFLSVHIRAVGPWTRNIRKLYDPALLLTKSLPKVLLDGPYGEGHQDWYKYEVSILIGGGIGVTPFASILKQIAHNSRSGVQKQMCKKIYFLWVTRTQKQFEWLTDIIREVEVNDQNNIVSVHVFITQFKDKFDFRTTMLYICERHFQKISKRSLFTGLKSITHFGRPDFDQLFKLLEKEHPATNVFGVFSCGPPPLTRSVEEACASENKLTRDVLFIHHYENF